MIELRFSDAGLQPPPVSELIKTIQQKPKVIEGVVGFLVKQGTLVRLADGVYVHHNNLTTAREKMATRRGETIDVGQFKEFFGLALASVGFGIWIVLAPSSVPGLMPSM